jgi:hypothetical protein
MPKSGRDEYAVLILADGVNSERHIRRPYTVQSNITASRMQRATLGGACSLRC